MTSYEFLTIRQAARRGPLGEYHLRRLRAEGKLPGITSGNRYYVNYPKLLEMLDRESEVRG